MDLTEKWVIAWDTLCTGWQCFTECDQETGTDLEVPIYYDSEEEAQREIDEDPEFHEDCFVVRASEYVHGRKAIFTGGAEGGYIEGQKLDKTGRIKSDDS